MTLLNITMILFFELLESDKKLRENKDFCNIVIPFEDTKILLFHQYKKSDEAVLIVYAEHECVIEKIDICKYNPENSSITKESEHIYQVLQCLHYLHLEA